MVKSPSISQRIVDLFNTIIWMLKYFFLSMIGREPRTPDERNRAKNDRKRQAFLAKMQKPIDFSCGPSG